MKRMLLKNRLESQIPNILTFFRIILVPFFIFSLFGRGALSGLIALILFTFASISDYFDGYFARKWNIHTQFGVFIDPLADKILVGGAFISFILLPDFFIPIWLVIVILLREITVTLLRMAALRKKQPIKTEYSGKVKTAFQMFSVFCILIILFIKKIFLSIKPGLINIGGIEFWTKIAGDRHGLIIYYLPLILVSISASLALFSMFQYLIKNIILFSHFGRKKALQLVVKIVSTGFFAGYIPVAPGTFGTLVGIGIWVLLSRSIFYYAATFILVTLGFVFSDYAEKYIFLKRDSSKIVIDEVSGILITFLSFQFKPGLSGMIYLVFGFLFFRFFDIIKPPPIRIIQKYRGGTGIMLDDIVSGIFANALLQILRAVFFHI